MLKKKRKKSKILKADSKIPADVAQLMEHGFDINNGTFLLTGGIDEDSAKRFAAFTQILLSSKDGDDDTQSNVWIEINSDGGNPSDSINIGNNIKRLQDNNFFVNGRASGACESAAFYILQCCDWRIAGNNTVLMYHTGTTNYPDGMNPYEILTQVKSCIEQSEKMDDVVFARINRDKYPDIRRFRAQLDQGISIVAADGFEHGFIDELG